MVKRIVSFTLDVKLLKDIDDMYYEELQKAITKKEKLSKSEFVERLIKLGIRARKEGFVFL
mgnify:CR=1 FL=1